MQLSVRGMGYTGLGCDFAQKIKFKFNCLLKKKNIKAMITTIKTQIQQIVFIPSHINQIQNFRGLKRNIFTLNIHYYQPIFREYSLFFA